jgi:integration host factor subunit beta|tara:strand:- start:24 stop:335 length:312 start_codon:yes stop_codon:yes gene_type:complete
MVRSELESKLAEQNPNILRKDIEKIVDTILIEISEALAKGKNIEIRGFGSYKVKIRKARTGRNPKNSKTIKIPEKKAIKWKMSKILFNKLNNNFTENKISGTY